MKKDTFYFSHDYNAHSDVKILYMRHQLGMEGYGIYWYLIESLADAGGYLPLELIPVLAVQMQTSDVKVRAIVEKFNLFQITDNQFFSLRLNTHLQLRNNLSENGKKGATARWGNSHPISHPIGTPNAKERKVKEIKVKESKVNEILDLPFNSPDFKLSWNDWKEYKLTQHNFKYKSVKSEKIALSQLLELSQNSCENALKIINQSIANGWKGFFELKTTNNGINKKQTGVEQLLAKAKRDYEAYTGGNSNL